MSAPDRVLQVLPTRERVAELLRARVRQRGAALALGLIDLRSLEDRLLRASGMQVVGATEARLALGAVAPEAARSTTLAELATQPGFADAFLELWDALRRAGIERDDFVRLAERLARTNPRSSPGPSLSARRFEALAKIAAAYEDRLAARQVVDGAGARLRLPAALAELSPSRIRALLDGASVVEFDGIGEVSVVRARMLQALARADVRVRVLVPEVPPNLAAAELGVALELSRRNLIDEAPDVELIARPLARAGLLAFVAPGSARSLIDPRMAQRIRLLDAEDLRAELRGVCAAIRDLLHAGVAPHRITLAIPRLPWHRTRVIAALDSAEIAWDEARPRTLVQHAAPLRLALALIEAAERGLPREELAAVLESAYVIKRGSSLLIQALREAGSRDDRGPGHLARLRQHAERLARGSPREQDRATKLLALADDWQRPFERLKLRDQATLADHLDDLFAALRTLGVPRRCLNLPGVGMGARERRFERDAVLALARDRQALEALEVAGHGLVEAAKAVGIAERAIGLTEFRGHLEAALAGLAGPPPSVRGSGVALRDLAEFAGSTTDHLFVLHAVEGELPGPGRALPFLDEDDRLALDRAAGRPVLAPPGAADAAAFALACAGAREGLVISCHRQDGEGRELLRSRWFVALADALRSTRELPASVVAPLALASTRGQVLARLGLQAAQEAELDGPALALLELGVHTRPELARALAWIRARASDPQRARVRLDPSTLALAHRLLDFDASGQRAATPEQAGLVWRGSATALEHYASCPFRLFADRVLRVRPRPSIRDELDAREQGQVRHQVLFEVMQALREAGLTPLRGGDQTWRENELALEVCEGVLDRWQARERTGPRALWILHRDLVVRDLLRLLEGERRAAIEAWEPEQFERGFGLPDPADATRIEGEPLAIPSREGQRRFELVGRVDRIDARGEGREREGLVIDYKSGRVGERLRYDQLARTQLQLPLYAAWLAAVRPELDHADAMYVSLRDGERSKVSMLDLVLSSVELDGLLELAPDRRAELRERARGEAKPGDPIGAPRLAAGALDLPATGQRNLADNVWALLTGIAEGHFDVRPFEAGRTCALCPFGVVCRIERGDELGGVAAGEEPEP
ncbi:PD-(D/E)XK nuclease family protein [Nannocystaceae bacterium ST9]